MFFKYFLCLFLSGQSWSFLVSPYDRPHRRVRQVTLDLKDVGEPLILTPYIKSGRIEEARKLSTVDPLLNGSGIVSNSGYFTVDEKHNSNLFFWFIRKTGGNWAKAPLLLWLQGGPGGSSLFGLFEENGPYFISSKKVELREYAWTKHYNVLYIDQPVGTGFSFTDDGYVRTQEEIADHLYEALTQFFQLYPQMRRNEFYMTGESYAGKYIPAVGYKIHRLKMANLTDINLKGLFIISAYTNGLENGYVNFCFQVGLIDAKSKQELELIEEEIESLILSRSWDEASELRHSLHEKIIQISTANGYDLRKPDIPVEESYIEFIQSSDIRKKIHVGNSSYELSSATVSEFLAGEKAVSVQPWIEELLEHYPMVFVGGQYDLRVVYPVVVNTLKKLEWKGAYEYSKAKRNKFFSGRKGLCAGYYKTAGNLTDVLIRGAGHMVPRDQPQATLDLLRMFINNRFDDSNYRTTNFRNYQNSKFYTPPTINQYYTGWFSKYT